MAPTFTLTPLSSLEITTIVTDEVDHFGSSPSPLVAKAPGLFGGVVPLGQGSRCGAALELPMERLCCGALGLSLGLAATPAASDDPESKSSARTLLFDAGPMGDLWAQNASNVGYDAGRVEHVHLSHWHRDHSGGLVKAIQTIQDGKRDKADREKTPVVVDVHPNRPAFRGARTEKATISMQADPTFNELEAAGAKVEKMAEPHLVLGGAFLVSGEIPRVTEYEGGLPGGVRLDEGREEWDVDELILDERMIVCLLEGKGMVIFTGCSHAGVVNVCLHAKELVPDQPIYCVVGGYHLADASAEKLNSSLEGLMKLEPVLCMPGHCTGWKFKFMIEKEMPGQMVPLVAGGKYTL